MLRGPHMRFRLGSCWLTTPSTSLPEWQRFRTCRERGGGRPTTKQVDVILANAARAHQAGSVHNTAWHAGAACLFPANRRVGYKTGYQLHVLLRSSCLKRLSCEMCSLPAGACPSIPQWSVQRQKLQHRPGQHHDDLQQDPHQPAALTWLSPLGLSGCRMEPLQLLPGRGSAPTTSSLLPQMRAVDSGSVGLLLRSCSRLCRSSSPCSNRRRKGDRANSQHMQQGSLRTTACCCTSQQEGGVL